MDKVPFCTDNSHNMAIAMILISLPTAYTLTFQIADYGRYNTFRHNLLKFKVPNFSASFAWMLQESPSAIIPLLGLYYIGFNHCLALFAFHYVYRAFYYPMQLKHTTQMPIYILAMAFVFCLYNGYMQTCYEVFNPIHKSGLIAQIVGHILFFTGFYTHLWSDRYLLQLKEKAVAKNQRYLVPSEGIFVYITCPNYFGEMLQWLGFSLISWSLPAFAFFIFTCANLVPRAYSHHEWYKGTFPNYPRQRNILIPLIW